MLNRVSASTYTQPIVTNQELIEFCACLDPNQLGLLTGLALAAQDAVETYLGDFITQRSIRWVAARGESEKTDEFFRSWLSARAMVSVNLNAISGQWVQFPTAATSIESCTLGIWGKDDVEITLGTDYVVDLTNDPARLTFSYNSVFSDYFNNYDHMVIDYTGGIAPSGSEPEAIKLAIKIITKKLFDGRSDTGTLIDDGVEFLLGNYRRIGFGGSR